MRKKLLSLLSILIIILTIAFLCYLRNYRISDNKKQLEENIKAFINRPTVVVNNIDIKQELNIDNKKYVMYIIDNGTLGEAELTKGINNKYKIDSAGYGSGFFECEIYKTNKGKYLIIKGENYHMQIASIKVPVDDKVYKFNIPQQKYFLVYCPVPDQTEIILPDFNKIKIYDKNDIDITHEVLKALL